jgi:hypothetical protein
MWYASTTKKIHQFSYTESLVRTIEKGKACLMNGLWTRKSVGRKEIVGYAMAHSIGACTWAALPITPNKTWFWKSMFSKNQFFSYLHSHLCSSLIKLVSAANFLLPCNRPWRWRRSKPNWRETGLSDQVSARMASLHVWCKFLESQCLHEYKTIHSPLIKASGWVCIEGHLG